MLDVPIADHGELEADMARYRREGDARAGALGNRGPIVLDAEAHVDQATFDAYEEHGSYVFTARSGLSQWVQPSWCQRPTRCATTARSTSASERFAGAVSTRYG